MTQSVGGLSLLRLYLFGHFRIERDGQAIPLPTRKIELLLAYLVLNPGVHSREQVAALLWSEVADSSARASLRSALSSLRRLLDPGLIIADRITVQINPDYPLRVDVLDFEAQASHFLDAPFPNSDAVNLSLYAADLLVDSYEDWVLSERERLRRLYLEILLELTQHMRSQSEYRRAIEYAERVLVADRAHERAHQHLMFCYVALGERTAALRQYEACRDALHEELAVEPSPATRRLHDWVRQASAERISVEAAITNLPIPLTNFVGRKREMMALKGQLSTERLLTLTGAGGSGKTRLAIQVSTDVLNEYPDGVWWVELATVVDHDMLPRAVAKALGVPEVPRQSVSDTLVNFLKSKELLLILDNCEHLIEASAYLVERLLSECPGLKVLATSRERLGIVGEHVWLVPSLTLPEPEQASDPSVDALMNYGAIRLFVERAAAVRSSFSLTAENAPSITEVCQRLEGLPLAIELAAARVGVLAVEEIATRLEDAFHLLTDGSRTALPRHQTLRAAIDWSHMLLSDAERTLFRRVSIFSGGWALPAAEAVCTGGGIEQQDVLELLSQLVAKSLVEAHVYGAETRYRMLETIRHYSTERLYASDEARTVRDRHLRYFSGLVEAAEPNWGYFLNDADSEVWLPRLEIEYDNLRAAIHWSIEGANNTPSSVQAGLRMAHLLHWFWVARGQFSEGRLWLGRLLDSDSRVPITTRARALVTSGYLACWQGDFSTGRAPLEKALDLFHHLEDGAGIAFSLHGLGFVALGEGDTATSQLRFEQSLHAATEAGVRWLMSFALHFLAIVLTYQGDYARAESVFEESDALLHEMGGNRQGLSFSLFHRARIARLLGDYHLAKQRYIRSLEIFHRVGDRRGIGYALTGIAVLAALQGEAQRAARLAGAVASLRDLLGSFLEPPLQVEYDREMTKVKAVLGKESFDALFAEGHALTIEQVIQYALVTDNS